MAKILIVHQNFPGQFPYIAQALQQRGHDVITMGGPTARPMNGIPFRRWTTKRGSTKGILNAAVRAEADLIRAEAAATAARQLRAEGFVPDVIIAHPSWGETLHFNVIFPDAKQILFGELYYRSKGLDFAFDPEFTSNDEANELRINAKNTTQALAYVSADVIVCPTPFQASTFPDVFQPKIRILHEGVDTERAKRRPGATVKLKDGRVLDGSKPVITFINRTLEPMRGFHIFMRALPAFLDAVPEAEVVIIGKEEGSGYGPVPTDDKSWKNVMLAELGNRLDRKRVHFLGTVPHDTMVEALSISWAHVYFTYPFVLSWSLLEAMACECLVIGSDTPPLHDAIANGREGILTGFFDVDGLSHALIAAASAPRVFQSLRQAARDRVIAHFELQTTGVRGWIKLAENLLI